VRSPGACALWQGPLAPGPWLAACLGQRLQGRLQGRRRGRPTCTLMTLPRMSLQLSAIATILSALSIRSLWESPTSCRSCCFFSSMSRRLLFSTCAGTQAALVAKCQSDRPSYVHPVRRQQPEGGAGGGGGRQQRLHALPCPAAPRTSLISATVFVSNRASALRMASEAGPGFLAAV
jgi:hypothetical protein